MYRLKKPILPFGRSQIRLVFFVLIRWKWKIYDLTYCIWNYNFSFHRFKHLSILIIFLSSTLDQIPTFFLIHNLAIVFPSYNLRNHVTEKGSTTKIRHFCYILFWKRFSCRKDESFDVQKGRCLSILCIYLTYNVLCLSNYFAIAFKFVLGFIQKN